MWPDWQTLRAFGVIPNGVDHYPIGGVRSTWSASPATALTGVGSASNRPRSDIEAARVTRSTWPAAPLYTGHGLLTDKQRDRLESLFAADEHVEVEASWGIYQRVVAAYREPDKATGKSMMQP